MSDPIEINAVNAFYDDSDNTVVLLLRPKGQGVREHSEDFLEFRLSIVEADQVASQLYLLTRNRIAAAVEERRAARRTTEPTEEPSNGE